MLDLPGKGHRDIIHSIRGEKEMLSCQWVTFVSPGIYNFTRAQAKVLAIIGWSFWMDVLLERKQCHPVFWILHVFTPSHFHKLKKVRTYFSFYWGSGSQPVGLNPSGGQTTFWQGHLKQLEEHRHLLFITVTKLQWWSTNKNTFMAGVTTT
jgi:predicted cupin superfamily sugar epimerase